MLQQRRLELRRFGVPEPHGSVAADRHQMAAVGAERDRRDGAKVSIERRTPRAGSRVEQLDRTEREAHGDEPA